MDNNLTNQEELYHMVQQQQQAILELRAKLVQQKINQTQEKIWQQEQLLQMKSNQVEKIKIKFPDRFDGTRSKARAFINKLENCFDQSSAYATDKSRIFMFNNLLQGAAEDWNNPHLERPELYHFLNSWTSLKNHFLETFSVVDRQSSASKEIQTLKQTTSAVTYVTKFQQLAADLQG
jgi:hypothetical protein